MKKVKITDDDNSEDKTIFNKWVKRLIVFIYILAPFIVIGLMSVYFVNKIDTIENKIKPIENVGQQYNDSLKYIITQDTIVTKTIVQQLKPQKEEEPTDSSKNVSDKKN